MDILPTVELDCDSVLFVFLAKNLAKVERRAEEIHSCRLLLSMQNNSEAMASHFVGR